MPSQPAKAEREDGGEAARLEAEHEHQHGDGRRAVRVHGRDDEHEAEPQIYSQHVPRLEEGDGQETAGNEAVEGVEALAYGEEVGYCLALVQVQAVQKERPLTSRRAVTPSLHAKVHKIVLPDSSQQHHNPLPKTPLTATATCAPT